MKSELLFVSNEKLTKDQINLIREIDFQKVGDSKVDINFNKTFNKVVFPINTQVNFSAMSLDAPIYDVKESPKYILLSSLMRNEFLHKRVREQGGAYGGGASYDPFSGTFKFFSYRDPRCSETFEEFQKSREWSLKNITQEQLDEGVLGIISSIDKPLSPFGEAMSDFSMNLDKKDLEARLRIRSLVKSCSLDDLVNVSQKYLFNESKRSVIAGENYIDEMKKLNFKIQNI